MPSTSIPGVCTHPNVCDAHSTCQGAHTPQCVLCSLDSVSACKHIPTFVECAELLPGARARNLSVCIATQPTLVTLIPAPTGAFSAGKINIAVIDGKHKFKGTERNYNAW